MRQRDWVNLTRIQVQAEAELTGDALIRAQKQLREQCEAIRNKHFGPEKGRG
jgi:hypothetical protein